MDVSRPHAAVAPSLDVDVAVTLEGTTIPLTGREVAQLGPRGSQRGILEALDRLVRQGLVHRQEAGRALLYTLNREHLAAPAVEWLAGMRRELLHRLRERLSEWDPTPVTAALFGSFARADGDAESDVDLFVIRPAGVAEDSAAWRDQVERLRDDVLRWTGNRLAIAELPEQDVTALRRERPSVFESLRREGIGLAGADVAELISGSA